MSKSIIPFDQKEGKIWIDNEFIEWKDSKIHVLTHGLHYASCVYDGIRIYTGNPFLLDIHLKRLIKSAEMLDMRVDYSLDTLKQATIELIKIQKINFGYIRPFVWRGSEQLKISSPENKIHTAIACWATEDRYSQPLDINNGYKLTFGEWRRPPANCYPHESKSSGSYVISTIEKHKAERNGFHDAILLDYFGNITETTSCNIFFVFGNELHTPIPDCFLNGITRQKVIEIAKQHNITVIERKISKEEYQQANDAFLTSTSIEVTPIDMIESKKYERHEITKKIFNAFNSFII